MQGSTSTIYARWHEHLTEYNKMSSRRGEHRSHTIWRHPLAGSSLNTQKPGSLYKSLGSFCSRRVKHGKSGPWDTMLPLPRSPPCIPSHSLCPPFSKAPFSTSHYHSPLFFHQPCIVSRILHLSHSFTHHLFRIPYSISLSILSHSPLFLLDSVKHLPCRHSLPLYSSRHLQLVS